MQHGGGAAHTLTAEDPVCLPLYGRSEDPAKVTYSIPARGLWARSKQIQMNVNAGSVRLLAGPRECAPFMDLTAFCALLRLLTAPKSMEPMNSMMPNTVTKSTHIPHELATPRAQHASAQSTLAHLQTTMQSQRRAPMPPRSQCQVPRIQRGRSPRRPSGGTLRRRQPPRGARACYSMLTPRQIARCSGRVARTIPPDSPGTGPDEWWELFPTLPSILCSSSPLNIRPYAACMHPPAHATTAAASIYGSRRAAHLSPTNS